MLPTSEAKDCLRVWTSLATRWREIEICSQNERKLSVCREKTHVLHQIGVDVAAETNGVLEIGCKQQNLRAHDPYDPLMPIVGWSRETQLRLYKKTRA